MLDYCIEKNLVCDIELIKMQHINEARERMHNGDAKKRFAIDMKSTEELMRYRRIIAPPKPTPAGLLAAAGGTIDDVIARDLRVLFCGINPGLYSGATGNHFARPGNRFWAALHLGGFTPRVMKPWEKRELLSLGLGLTNFVARTTRKAAELNDAEIRAGTEILKRKVRRNRPRVLAVLGIGAYRVGFGLTRAGQGLQEQTVGETRIWVLPNPSGLNAHSTPASLGELFKQLNHAIDPAR